MKIYKQKKHSSPCVLIGSPTAETQKIQCYSPVLVMYDTCKLVQLYWIVCVLCVCVCVCVFVCVMCVCVCSGLLLSDCQWNVSGAMSACPAHKTHMIGQLTAWPQ